MYECLFSRYNVIVNSVFFTGQYNENMNVPAGFIGLYLIACLIWNDFLVFMPLLAE